ncbi:MAG: hypothetical protein ACLUVC_02295 [Longibaculum sp.]
MIYKFQRSLDGGMILVYNKSRNQFGQFMYTKEHDQIFKGKLKVYIDGYRDKSGRIIANRIVKDKNW